MSSHAGLVEVTRCARHSFGRELRLLTPAEFKRVFEGASKVTTRYLTLLARPNNLGYPRLGMAISRKNVRSAVKRNQIKRQVRESFRCQQQALGGIDIVVLARSGTTVWEWRELRTALDGKWQELRNRCKSC